MRGARRGLSERLPAVRPSNKAWIGQARSKPQLPANFAGAIPRCLERAQEACPTYSTRVSCERLHDGFTALESLAVDSLALRARMMDSGMIEAL